MIIDPTKTNLTLNEVQQFKNTAVEFAKIGGAVAAVPFAGSDDASAIYAGSYAGSNAAINNTTGLDTVIRIVATLPAAAVVGNGDIKEGYKKISKDFDIIKERAADKLQTASDNLYEQYPEAMSVLGLGLTTADTHFATPAANALNYPVTKVIDGVNYVADAASGQQNYLVNNGYDGDFWSGLLLTGSVALGVPSKTIGAAKYTNADSLVLQKSVNNTINATTITSDVASGFKGSKGFELINFGSQTRNSPAIIDGVDYSAHALDQMQNRGVMPSVAKNVMENGITFETRKGTLGFFDPLNQIKVITNSESGKVITVIRGAK